MSKKGWILLLTLGVVWGVPYLLIRIAITDYHPVIVAFGRAVVGAAILLPLAYRRGVLAAGFGKFGWVALYTIAELSGPWVLIGYAEQHVASSTAGLIIALTPTLAAALAMIGLTHSFSIKRVLGLVAGLAGVAVLMGFDANQPHWLAFAALALSALGYALGPLIVARKLSNHDATGVVAASLVLAALFYVPAVPMHWPGSFSWSATASIVALAALCTAFAFTMLFMLINEVGAARATLVAYINPAFAVLLGVLVLSEPFSLATVAGFLLIAIGTYLATREPQSQPNGSSAAPAPAGANGIAGSSIAPEARSRG